MTESMRFCNDGDVTRMSQTLTFRVILQGDANSLLGARETAVHLIDLNRRLGGLFQPLTVLPDILIWHNKSSQFLQRELWVLTIFWQQIRSLLTLPEPRLLKLLLIQCITSWSGSGDRLTALKWGFTNVPRRTYQRAEILHNVDPLHLRQDGQQLAHCGVRGAGLPVLQHWFCGVCWRFVVLYLEVSKADGLREGAPVRGHCVFGV